MARDWRMREIDQENFIERHPDGEVAYVDIGGLCRAACANLVRWLMKYSAVEVLPFRDGGIVLRTIPESVWQELCKDLGVSDG